MPPQTRYARCGELSIAYQVIGDGPPDLIVVPAFLWHVEQLWNDPGYHRFMRALSDFARVIVYDKRGTGLSDPVLAAPSLDERMDDVLAVLDAVGSDRATVFGPSEGGAISAVFAASHPDRTERLIVYGSLACGPQHPACPAVERGAAGWELVNHSRERWGEGANIEWGAPSVDSPTMRRFDGLLDRTSMSPAMARANLSANFEIDVRPILPSVGVPTLVLHRRDEFIPIEHGRCYAEDIPGARLVELEGSDHWPFVGDVDSLIGEIEEFVTGTRAAHAADRVLATVLFTDIVGSTERVARLGDSAWRAVLQEHDQFVRGQIAAHEGRERKQLGDGFLATFDRPARAVRCATAIAGQAAELGIGVRAGLHTGECEQHGDDVAGVAVHIGARIGALAGPGEVLVSGTLHDLVLGSGIEFSDRGFHTLKGVPGDWRLFAVADSKPPKPLIDDRSTTAPVTDRALLAAGRRAPGLGRVIIGQVRRRSIRRRG